MRVVNVAGNPFDVFNAQLYGVPSEEYRYQLSQQVHNFMNRLGQVSTHVVNSVTHMFDRFNSDAAIQQAQEVLAESQQILRLDTVYRIDNTNYKQITPYMQSVVMANPRIRTYYEDGEIYGYDETNPYLESLVDYKDSSLYQNAMSGVTTTMDLHLEDPFLYSDTSHYSFTNSEKDDILDSWDYVLQQLDDSNDITDI